MTMIGGGGVNWHDQNLPAGSVIPESDSFFILEPEVNVTLNVTEYFRVSAGLSYRFINGIQSTASSNPALSGPSGMVIFQFGKF